MSKRKRKAAPVNDGSNASSPKIPKGDIIRLLALIATVAGVYGAYKFFLSAFEDYTLHILIIYSVLATVSTLTYVIYNRGFSRRGLTPEMLPDTMSAEEKQEFIEDGEVAVRVSDFRNLGYQYLKYHGEPYFECENCGLTVRQNNKKTGRRQKYCQSCAAEIKIQQTINSVMRRRAKTTI